VTGTPFWLTTGWLSASDHQDRSFQLLWHMTDGRPLIDEIIAIGTPAWPRLPGREYARSNPCLWHLPFGPEQVAAMTSDPVVRLLLGPTVASLGIVPAARCLAAWWRLDPAVADALTDDAGEEVVAAALDKLVARQASYVRRADLHVAAQYGADPAAMKSMTGRLQRRLALGPTQPW
jgi:hypothetical protein